MTTEQAISIIKLSLTGMDSASADKVAGSLLSYGLVKVARKRGVDFNREYATFILSSGKNSYVLGQELFSANPNVWNLQEMYHTDVAGRPITVLGLVDFNDRARGSSTTGRPTIATVHSNPRTLEVFPNPDKDYTVKGYVSKTIEQLSDIPDIYHDVPIDFAGLAIKAATDASVAAMLLKEGLADLMADAGAHWSGGKILIDRPLGTEGGGRIADSSNITGI